MEIENIELSFLSYSDYQELKNAMIEAYTNLPNTYWAHFHPQYFPPDGGARGHDPRQVRNKANRIYVCVFHGFRGGADGLRSQ